MARCVECGAEAIWDLCSGCFRKALVDRQRRQAIVVAWVLGAGGLGCVLAVVLGVHNIGSLEGQWSAIIGGAIAFFVGVVLTVTGLRR